MRKLTVENELRDVVSRVISQVELATAQGRTDINLALEDALIPILRSAYNLPNLINLNRRRKNYPGIDLGDDTDRVAFQITSTTSLDKVKGTVKQFMDRSYYNSFDELYVLILTRKQASYSQAAINTLLSDQFSFNSKKHIIDLGDVLREVSGLRLAAQERVLSEFRRILSEANAYNEFNSRTDDAPTTITSNLQRIELPQAIYVADLVIDDKATIRRAKAELGYKGGAKRRRAVVKMALLLDGVQTDGWVEHGGKLFAFEEMDRSGLAAVVDPGSIERLEAADLGDSSEPDNVNVLKQLLIAQTQEQLKLYDVRLHPMDRFFYFGPSGEGQAERKANWTGKRAAERRVYKAVVSKKDPSKIAHHQHFAFELKFLKIKEIWYASIVPNWYYSYNGYRQSRWHDELLSKQKRNERNESVRNAVRFVAYFLANIEHDAVGSSVRYGSLIDFEVAGSVEAKALDDDDCDDDVDALDEIAA